MQGTCVGKIPWRRKWQSTLVFLPGKSRGQRSLAGYSPWSQKVGHNLASKPLSPSTNIALKISVFMNESTLLVYKHMHLSRDAF